MSKQMKITKIEEEKKVGFLELYYGDLATTLRFENFFYATAREHLKGYTGGMWNYYEVEYEGTKSPLMVLKYSEEKAILNGAYCEIETDVFTASLSLFVMAQNHFLNMMGESELRSALIEQHQALHWWAYENKDEVHKVDTEALFEFTD